MFFRISLQPEKGKFKRGTVETFNVEALDVGAIKAIEVNLNEARVSPVVPNLFFPALLFLF